MKTFWKIFFGSLLGCIVAIILFGFILIGMIGSLTSFSNETAQPVPPKAILKIDFSTPIEERTKDNAFSLNIASLSSANMDFSGSMSILDAIRAIDNAAEDPAIQFIYINTDKMNMAMSHTEELRNALKRFRESGKAVIAYGTNFSTQSYFLASVADKVIMDKNGDVAIMGIASNVVFFKGLLDKLGVRMQLVRHGKYKSAGEQFVADEMSPANREQNEVMLNSLWNSWSKKICESRSFSGDDLDKWINNLDLADGDALLERKMIDELYQRKELKEYLCTLFDVTESKDLKFVDIAKYAKAKAKDNVRAKEKIAILYAEGEIVLSDNDGIGGIEYAEEIEKLRKDSTVKAVVFRVNSPGGSAQGAEIIRNEIEELAKVKPVIASYGEYAASGGYWISAGANKIFADESTLTGSIGVFSLVPNIGSAFEKTLKVKNFAISTHKHGDMLFGMRDLTSSETVFMQNMVEKIYSQFVSIVAEGRSMNPKDVDEIAQGRVWTGSDALKIGLVDEIGDIADAVEYAAATANLENYKVVEVPAMKSGYEKLLESLTKGSSAKMGLTDPLQSLETTYSFLKTATEPMVFARMPYIYVK